MIGIITYISVLERTKEIGILRSVGASKKDISRVFNAETVIVGFGAGLIGIGITLLLNIPISILVEKLTGISGIAVLPATAAVASYQGDRQTCIKHIRTATTPSTCIAGGRAAEERSRKSR